MTELQMSRSITLRDIKPYKPCVEGWKKLVAGLGTRELDTRLTLADIFRINGRDDMYWAFQCLDRRVSIGAIMPTLMRAAANTQDTSVHDSTSKIKKWLADDSDESYCHLSAFTIFRSAAHTVAQTFAQTAAHIAGQTAGLEAYYACVVAEQRQQDLDMIAYFGELHPAETTVANDDRTALYAAKAAAKAAAAAYDAAYAAERQRQIINMHEYFGDIHSAGKEKD